jgi:galactokinase
MDQMASSVGGVVGIDFADPADPVVEQIRLDLADAGLALCILDSGADHADLTDEYAAIPKECKAVAALCGGEVLRDVPYEVFMSKIGQCRRELGDRALLRAMHFYSDNARVPQQIAALRNRDYAAFLGLINESGHSSWECLQNVSTAGAVQQQAVAVTIALAKQILAGRGAVRVHGGGFAGTVQAFVPLELMAEFKEKTEAVLGAGTCNVMVIRPVGGIRIA